MFDQQTAAAHIVSTQTEPTPPSWPSAEYNDSIGAAPLFIWGGLTMQKVGRWESVQPDANKASDGSRCSRKRQAINGA